MSLKYNRFDTMIPFFGREDDRRVTLYLHALETEANANADKLIDLKLTADFKGASSGIVPELQNQFFDKPDPVPATDVAVHSEWDEFAHNLETRLAAKTEVTHGLSNQVLDIIRNFGVVSSAPSEVFFQRVIKAHLEVITNSAGENITNRPFDWSTATGFTFKDQANLANIYSGAGMKSHSVASGPGDNKVRFGFKLDKFLQHALENHAAISLGKDNFWSATEIPTNKFFRSPSDPKKIYMRDASENNVDVTTGSTAHKGLDMKTCKGTYVKHNGTLTCDDYILKCIVNGDPNDIASCKEFMMDSDFWAIMPDDVDKMLPRTMVDTLQKFGFAYDSRKMQLKTFESVGSWSYKLHKKIAIGQLTESEYKAIINNVKLTQYLTLLVNKVNQSPAILNDDYFESAILNREDLGSRFKDWTPYGLTPRVFIKSDTTYDIARQASFITTNFARTRSFAQRNLTVLPGGQILSNGVPFVISQPYFVSSYRMTGGANENKVFMNGGGNENEVFAKQSSLLQNLLTHAENKLKSMGKTLDIDTRNEIEKHMRQYKDAENKLHRAIAYTDKYIDLIQLFKEYDNSNLLNMDHLKSFVEAREKYFDKTETRQNSIISVIQQMADRIIDRIDNDPMDNNLPSKTVPTGSMHI